MDLAVATQGGLGQVPALAFSTHSGTNPTSPPTPAKEVSVISSAPMTAGGKAASIMRSAGICSAAAIVASGVAVARRQRRPIVGQQVVVPLRPFKANCQQQTIRRAATSAAAPPQVIDDLLKEHSVVVFSKTTCPFCARAKSVLEAEGVKFHVHELDQMSPEDMNAMQDTLREMTGARTVPRIFISGQSMGGCDDVVSLQESGKLVEMVPADAKTGPPANFKMQMSDDEWFDKLGRAKYSILRQAGTEPPGTHEYNRFMPQKGYFACGACGLPLYSADSKFRSSCGWPVFDKCYFSEDAGGCHVGTKPDFGSLEIVCKRCDSHLGHVFFDAFSATNPNGERH